MIGIDSMSQQVRKDRNKENPSYSWPVTKFVATPIYSIYFQSLIMLLFLYYIIKYNDCLIIFDCLLVGMHVCHLMPVEVRTNFWNTVLSFHLLNSKDWIQVVRLGHKHVIHWAIPLSSLYLVQIQISRVSINGSCELTREQLTWERGSPCTLGLRLTIACWEWGSPCMLGKRLAVHAGKEAHCACWEWGP